MPAPIALDFTDEERLSFWSRVAMTVDVRRCWVMEPNRTLNSGGYGTHLIGAVRPSRRLRAGKAT